MHLSLLCAGAPLMAQPDSLAARRGLFTQHSLFVTPYDPRQRFPAGTHVVQSTQDMGLGEWLKQVRHEEANICSLFLG